MEKAYVLVNTQIGEEQAVAHQIAKIKGVTTTHLVYGVYDIIALVEHESKEMLKQIITEKVRRVKNVRSTLTLAVLSDETEEKP